jgi:hypothetical protein
MVTLTHVLEEPYRGQRKTRYSRESRRVTVAGAMPRGLSAGSRRPEFLPTVGF